MSPDLYLGKNVIEIFEDQVYYQPLKTAISDHSELISYQSLNDMANIIAKNLIERGVNAGDKIGLFMERSIPFIASILGTLKAGAVYVPLDPGYPESRIRFMLKNSEIKLTIFADTLVSKLEIFKTDSISYSEIISFNSNSTIINPKIRVGGGHTAYIMYTSGSTGTPKGSLIPDSGIIRLVINTNYISITPNDVIAHSSNISFDASTFEIWGALLNGARIAIISQKELLSPRAFHEILTNHSINIIFLTTALFALFMRHNPEMFKKLSYVLFGGEVGDPLAVSMALAANIHTNFIHCYGPTENTTFSTCYRIPRDTTKRSYIPIGEPISGTDAFVLSENLDPVKDGEVGELFLGGDGLSSGYINEPELTNQKFIKSPFTGSLTDRLYRTGDLVKMHPDGNLEFIGRIDDQVKIHGLRVELEEIKFIIKRHASIEDAAVIVLERDFVGKFIVAFYRQKSTKIISPEFLSAFLSENLPYYMLPSILIPVEAIPLNPNGKTDKKSLEAIYDRFVHEQGASNEAQDIHYKQLLKIWQKYQPNKNITDDTDFFRNGGDSLSAANMILELGDEFKVDLPISLIQKYASPAVVYNEIMRLIKVRSDKNPKANASLIRLSAKCNKKRIYLIPPGEGWYYSFSSLAAELEEYFEVYSFDSTFLSRSGKEGITIEGIASEYITLIKAANLEEDFYLCGWSLGSVIAFEMAYQLSIQGHRNSKLVLLDPTPLRHFRKNAQLPISLRIYFRFRPTTERYLKSLLLQLQIFIYASKRAKRGESQRQKKKISIKKNVPSRNLFIKSYEMYKPKIVEADTMALWAKDRYRSTLEIRVVKYFSGYSRRCSGAYMDAIIPGDHDSILKYPNCIDLTDKIVYFLKTKSDQFYQPKTKNLY